MPAKKEVSPKKVTSNKKQVTSKKTSTEAEVKSVAVKQSAKAGGLTIPVYSLAGRASTTTLNLPKEIFGGEVNNNLLNQAIRVYLNNKKGHFGNTKTRGEVEGSTRKLFKQKGTGRARHGSIRANIFVGGGIVFGPKVRKVSLELPQKMKKSALISALSMKAKNGEIKAITGLDKASGKTKEMSTLLKTLGLKSALFLTTGEEQALRATRNLKGVKLLTAEGLNALEVASYQSLILTKEAVEKLEQRMKGSVAEEKGEKKS